MSLDVSPHLLQTYINILMVLAGACTHTPPHMPTCIHCCIYEHTQRSDYRPPYRRHIPSLSSPPLPPSLPLVTQRIHCPFQPKQSPSQCPYIQYAIYYPDC